MLRLLLAMTLLSCVSGCVSAVNSNAICDGTFSARAKHAAALAIDGGDASVVTGANLIMMIDAACSN
jgi:hypothetical protein